jgi:hypothetical protein
MGTKWVQVQTAQVKVILQQQYHLQYFIQTTEPIHFAVGSAALTICVFHI